MIEYNDPDMKPAPHFHCVGVEVTDDLVNSCRTSYRKYRSKVEEAKEVTETETERIKETKKKFKELEEKSSTEFATKVSKRKTFLPPCNMVRVYETEKEKKKRLAGEKVGKTAETTASAPKQAAGSSANKRKANASSVRSAGAKKVRKVK